jgi:hypothetical protein
MLFLRSSTSTRASPPPRQAGKPFFEECWYPEKLHQSRDINRDDTREKLVGEQESIAVLI